MADKNIQMTQRNAANTEWDNLYPKTKIENLENHKNLYKQFDPLPNTTTVANYIKSLHNLNPLLAGGSFTAEGSSDLPTTDWGYGIEFIRVQNTAYRVIAHKSINNAIYIRFLDANIGAWNTNWTVLSLNDGNLQTGLNAEKVGGKTLTQIMNYEKDNGQPLEISEFIDFHKVGSNTDFDVRVSINPTTGELWSYNNINGYKARKILNQDDYDQLFQYANNGKTSIANAIGDITSASTHQQIADHVINLKNQISTDLASKGVSIPSSNTLWSLANGIKSISTGKKFASGTSTCDASGNFAVSGLSFKPSLVHGISNTIGFIMSEQYRIQNNKPIGSAFTVQYQSSTCGLIYGGFTNDGFNVQGHIGNYVVNWYAYE